MQSHIWLTASSYMVKYLRISSYIRKPVLIYDFATWSYLNFLIFMGKILFSFLSVCVCWIVVESQRGDHCSCHARHLCAGGAVSSVAVIAAAAAAVLPPCCRRAAALLPACCRRAAGVLPLCCRHAAAELPPCCHSSAAVTPESLHSVP